MLAILPAHLKKNEIDTGLNKSLHSEMKVHLLSLKEELSNQSHQIKVVFFPTLANIILKIPLSLPTTYACVLGSSSLLQIKTTHRSTQCGKQSSMCPYFNCSKHQETGRRQTSTTKMGLPCEFPIFCIVALIVMNNEIMDENSVTSVTFCKYMYVFAGARVL
jgi:hypothetical protein